MSGASAEEMYAPRLWYYNQLLFLCDQEALHSSVSSVQEEEEDNEVNLLFFFILFHFTVTSYSCTIFPGPEDAPAHKTPHDFSLEILEKRKNNDECILILVIYWKKTGHTKISNHKIIYSSMKPRKLSSLPLKS